MNYASLRKNILSLANLPAGEAPILSAYFNLQSSHTALMERFDTWAKTSRKSLDEESRAQFDRASEKIQEWLHAKWAKEKSAAIFSRAGEQPFFLPLTFKVPMTDFFHASDRPAIFPLVEIKDRFNRFVVVLTTQESARIIEINLGEASTELLAERPDIRKRNGREWTREHYQNHRRDRDLKFLKEKVEIIEGLMDKRGHNALIIAGEPRYVNRLQEALPKNLQEKVIDKIRTGIKDQRIQQILEEAIESYLSIEHDESTGLVKSLFQAVRTNGLATLGVAATENALRSSWADHLVISSSLAHDDRERLVRLASLHSIQIETVRNSPLLEEQGGVGALLRYLPKVISQENTQEKLEGVMEHAA